MVLQGVVTAGLGRATNTISESTEILKTALGVDIFPGTLNVLLAENFKQPHGTAIVIPSLGDRNMEFYLYQGFISNIRVWIIRSFSQVEVSDNLVEIISESHLRQTLQCEDGTRLKIVLTN